jgi:Flp pilus assembly protein TadB
MPAGERARRRAERERVAAAAEAERRAVAERQARRAARRTALARVVPGSSGRSSGQTGTLAARRRQQTVLTVAGVVAVNALLWLGTGDWAARAFLLLLSLLVTPIVVHLVTKP